MKLSNLTKITLFCLAVASISSCANLSNNSVEYKTPQKSHQLSDISHLTDREKADLYEMIIAADLSSANGEYALATSYYLAAARLSKSIELIELSVENATKAKDNLAILQASEIWLAIDPNSINGLSLKVAALLSHQDIDQATLHTVQLFEQLKDPSKRFGLIDKILQNQQPGVSNAYLEQLIIEYPKSETIHTAKANFFARVAKHTRNPSAMMKQALSHVEQALQIKEDFIPAVELKTRLLYQARQDEKAEAFLRNLYASHPKSKKISQMLGQLLYDLRKYDLTKQHYSNWLKKNKNDTEARFYLAASYFATSEFEKSLQQYRQILGSDYKPQLTYFFCGNAASQLKQYPQAIACYDLVTEGKYLTRAKIELAKIYRLTDQIDKALVTVRNPKFAIDQDSQIQLINIEIELLNHQDETAAAKQRLEKALANYPSNVTLLFRKVQIDDLSADSDKLIALFSQALEQITDENKVSLFNLSVANFFRNNNHYQQAVDWLSEALKQNPQDPDYLYARALYKEPLGLYEEMIADFKHLLTLDPENMNIINALGYTLVDVNQELEYAEQLIEQAFNAMPNNAAVIDSKGWLAYRKGLYQQALQFLTRAFKISPSADVATHIGEVYWTSGDKTKALEFWQQAKTMDPKNYLLLTTIKKLGVEL